MATPEENNHKDFDLIAIADVAEFRFDQRLYLM
jgi:hypothetical protein